MFWGHLAADLFFQLPSNDSCFLHTDALTWGRSAQHTLNLNKMYFLSWTFTKVIRLSVSLEDSETERSMNYQ